MRSSLHFCGGLLVAVVLVLLPACASTPVPNEQLAVGKSALASAQTAGAAEYAPLDLSAARAKLDQASAAQHDKRYADARRLAEEAEVDAQLAQAKTGSMKTQQAVGEINESIRLLRDEIDRAANQANQ